MLEENKGVTEAFGEGWNLVYRNFWKSVGVNFILGFLNGLLVLIVMIIPGVIVGLYTFHVVENNVDVDAGIVPTLIYTLGTCLVLIIGVFGQCLSQFVNGILYYSLNEKAYNTNTRSKIEQIGKSRTVNRYNISLLFLLLSFAVYAQATDTLRLKRRQGSVA